MIQIYNNKHLTWDGTTSINHYELFADTVTDLPSDPYCFSSPDKGNYKMAQGSIAWVIDVSEIYMLDSEGTWVLESISGGGGGGGGTTNYNALTNKPSINSVELSGNKTLSDLGIQSAIDSSHKLSADLVTNGTTNKFNMQADWTQADNTSGDYIKNKPTLGTAAATDATAYATAAQGTKADTAIQSVKIGGTALTPDSNKAVNITSIPSSVTATTQSQKDNSTKIATTAYVDKAISDLPEPMVWTGTITITADVSDTTKCSIVVSEPASAANIKQGFTYKIASIADTPAYTGTLKVGDTLIAAKDAPAVTSTWVADTDWNIVPSGDEPSGTVMSVTASNGLKTASGTAITATGDIQANLASTTVLSGNTIYNVGLNNSGNLAVKVPTVSKTAVGLTPQLPNETTTTKFLRQDGSWEVPAYTTVAEGSSNGTVKVNGSDVSVHGLGTAAYTASSAYATSTQGGKADTAIQSVKRNGTALTPDANNAVDVACIESLGSTPTANDIATWNTSTGLKDSGVLIETNTTFSSTSDTKIPTSKSITQNVAKNAVLTDYAIDTSSTIPAISSSKTINEAVGILEHKANQNQTNILLIEQKLAKVYGFHVNPNESDPSAAVTYLLDAVGMTPAKMGSTTFDYGSWANAFFMPKPCMLKSNGDVDYYLDPNDYSKKSDGTASDVADSNYDGNAMMEWGKIWFKYEAGQTDGEWSFYVSNQNVDGTYKCWCNINANNKEIDHFYTAIYNGTGCKSKMRSISGIQLTTANEADTTTAQQEIDAALANNTTQGHVEWYTETWADRLLINALLYLMGKSLNLQGTYGQGLSKSATSGVSDQQLKQNYVTGSLNDKGLFYGDITGTETAVKVFGMENLWACCWRRIAGCILNNGSLKVKMTYDTADGSTAHGYNLTGAGYLSYGGVPTSNNYVSKMKVDSDKGYIPSAVQSNSSYYYCDYFYQNQSIVDYLLLGGRSGSAGFCGFYCDLTYTASATSWVIAAALSFKHWGE